MGALKHVLGEADLKRDSIGSESRLKGWARMTHFTRQVEEGLSVPCCH